jgi:hypothetical protein
MLYIQTYYTLYCYTYIHTFIHTHIHKTCNTIYIHTYKHTCIQAFVYNYKAIICTYSHTYSFYEPRNKNMYVYTKNGNVCMRITPSPQQLPLLLVPEHFLRSLLKRRTHTTTFIHTYIHTYSMNGSCQYPLALIQQLLPG